MVFPETLVYVRKICLSQISHYKVYTNTYISVCKRELISINFMLEEQYLHDVFPNIVISVTKP